MLSDDVVRTAMQLRDRMVESCGFDNRSAEDALRVTASQTQRGLGFGRILLREPPPLNTLPPSLAAKARYDGPAGLLVLDEMLTRDEVKSLREAVVGEDDRRAIEDYWERERPVGTALKPLDQYARPIRVPRLTVEQAGRWSLLEPVELDEFAWSLEFQRHPFDLMFEMGQEEAECASHIDRHPNVARWIGNTEHATQDGFWLPKSPGKFFPDFIVELKDGRIVLVEYKMGKMASDPEEQHKKAVGELWAARSQGRCRFAWIVDRDWHKLNAELKTQAAFA